jgi:hypothetical protein
MLALLNFSKVERFPILFEDATIGPLQDASDKQLYIQP